MKKFLSLVLALVMILGTFGNVALADEEKLEYNTQESKIQWLIDKEIVIGRKINADGSAELDLDETLTRAEVTKLIVYTLKLQNLADALQGVMKPFPDVDIDHWANGYVSVATTQREDVAFGRRIVIGYEDGKFYPENNVTYAELATMLVRIVKEDLTPKMEEEAIWATSYMRWAKEEGILKGLTVLDSDKPVIRREAFEMIFNAMYALGDYNKAAIDFGDDIGIVSKLRDGILEINQEKEYKVTKDTVITDGTTWSSLGDNADKISAGSLVRYIVNEDNEVTHLIELGESLTYKSTDKNGNFVFNGGPINHRGWRGIIDEINDVVSGYGYFNVDRRGKFRDLRVQTGEDKNKNPVNFELEIDKDTRLFVADVHNNALKELKSLDEAFNYWSLADGSAGLLYAGYDEFSTRVGGAKTDVALAKVIVFNDVDKYQGYDEVRRVTDWYNSAKRYGVEDTKGNIEYLSTEELSAFPSILLNEIDYKDVVRIREGAHDPYLKRDVVEVIIDYSEDPVFEVAKVSDRLITLKDEDGYEREFAIDRDAYIFLEGELEKGAHVQVAWDIETNKWADEYGDGDDLFRYQVIKYFSVVDKDLEGELEEGIRKGTDSGYIIKISDDANQIDTVAITIADKLNGRNPRSYLVSREDLPFFYDVAEEDPENVIGEEVIFEIVRRFGADYVFAVEFKMTQDEQDLLREIQELGAIANDTDLEKAKRLLARAAGMKDLPPNVAAAVEDLKEEVEDYEKLQAKQNILEAWTAVTNEYSALTAYQNEKVLQSEAETMLAGLNAFKDVYDTEVEKNPGVASDTEVAQKARFYNNRVNAFNDNETITGFGIGSAVLIP